MVNKLIRNGKVAVMYSRGYGAGWSSWNRGWAEQLVFDADLALAVEKGDMAEAERIADALTGGDAYLGGVEGLTLTWLPAGTRFRINEYDGAESVIELEQEELTFSA